MRYLNFSSQSLKWLFAELIVVILGISIAFQVEEYRNELSEREAERRMLRSMQDDFSVAGREFASYQSRATVDFESAVALYDYLKSSDSRTAQDLVNLIRPLQFGYRWQATDSTWQASDPQRITSDELRAELIEFHDGAMPFMLNISTELQSARRELLDVLLDDFERIRRLDQSLDLRVTSELNQIPSNPEFFEKLGNFSIVSQNVVRRSITFQERISELQEGIAVHVNNL